MDAVTGVTFSPDGRRLATASKDQTARLWDAATGQQILALKGHRGGVMGVVFSPDGRRLATASRDETARVWDAFTGQELLTLKGPTVGFTGVAFSPDGRRLATASEDQTARVWEAEWLPPERRRQHFIERLVPVVWSEVLMKEELLARLRDFRFVSEAERRHMLALAKSYPPQAAPEDLNDASWAVARRPDADTAAYQLALRQAEAACRLAPDDGLLLNTLGVAHYRLGHYPEALATLSRSAKLNATPSRGPHPTDLAFRAMTYHRLGQAAPARDALGRLRDRMKEPGFADGDESRAFLREAEKVVEGYMPRVDR
jgi:hypothetical protein